MTTVITIPAALESRAHARQLTPATAGTCVLNATESRFARTSAVDELVKGILAAGIERVIVVNSSPSLQRQLEAVHRARATPERTFLMTFRTVDDEALLRAV